MAAESYRYNTAWHKAVEWYRHDGTAWRKAKERWRHDGTAWRKVFGGFTVASAAGFFSDIVNLSYVPQIQFLTDGTVNCNDTTNALPFAGNWGSPTTAGIGASYWIKAAFVSGNGTVGGTLGSWLQLNTARSWTINAAPVGQARNANLTYQIASDAAGVTIVGGGTMEFTSDRT